MMKLSRAFKNVSITTHHHHHQKNKDVEQPSMKISSQDSFTMTTVMLLKHISKDSI